MSYLILVRHGQSIWNLEKKFTGWVDVDLTENGKLEAKKSGELIKLQNINIYIFRFYQFTSFYSFRFSIFGQVYINPACEFFFKIPYTLAVSY